MALDHPMIMKLVKTFRDAKRVYFLTELIQGIDLFDALRDLNLLSVQNAQFYTGSLILALEHLYDKSIIHRDLKPENVMIDAEGYLKVIDFGTAKIIDRRTYTIIGTPHYMAPEAILGKGYNHSVDIWAIGIMLFEFMAGRLPFGEDLEDSYQVYETVVKEQYKYPMFLKKQPGVTALIDQLLNKKPANRGQVGSLRNHAWFKGFDWNRLLSRKTEAPLVPSQGKSTVGLLPKGPLDWVMDREVEEISLSRIKQRGPLEWDAEF
jgi:cGMP-dependent protein kinase